MEAFGKYIIEASLCVCLFQLFYILVLWKESGFKFLRIYLLSSVLFSLLLPLNTISIPNSFIISVQPVKYTPAINSIFRQNLIEHNAVSVNPAGVHFEHETIQIPSTDYYFWLKLIYIAVMFIIISRFLLSILHIINLYRKAEKINYWRFHLVKSNMFNYSFSFFNIIFVNTAELNENEIESILAHENIHASQYHTVDVILIELISAVMWFNPFVWLLRRSLRQVHEYLADEGVLNIGFDRLEYQALLVNQVAESRLLSLASGFNQSQIKKRIIMMTKFKSDNRTKLKILVVVPVAFMLFLRVAGVNGQKSRNANVSKDLPSRESNVVDKHEMANGRDALLADNTNTLPTSVSVSKNEDDNTNIQNSEVKDSTKNSLNVSPAENEGVVSATKMNVLYIGVDNPIDIAVAGKKSNELEVKIDNGIIIGSNGKFIAKPVKVGKAVITASVFRSKNLF